MLISDGVRMALMKADKTQTELSNYWGNSPQAMSNKFRLQRWTAQDLIRVGEFTGCRLALLFPDGTQIMLQDDAAKEPESAPETDA